MLFAVDRNNQKIAAASKADGWCSMCGEKLVAKCGQIVTHHWSHKSEDCDTWHEPETEWHLYWKSLVPPKYSEVTIEKDGQQHRADIVTKNNVIIELQHSPLSIDEIAEREFFYGKMIWLFDVQTCRPTRDANGTPLPGWAKQIRLRLRHKPGEPDLYTFRWVHPRRSIAYTQSPTYLDVGAGEIFKLDWMSKNTPCGGKGKVRPQREFENWLRRQCDAA